MVGCPASARGAQSTGLLMHAAVSRTQGGAPYPALYPSQEGSAGRAGPQSWGPVGPSTEAGVAESARAAAVPWLRVMTRCASVA